MKVALCISGQPRFYNSLSYYSLKKYIIDMYEADVYIHSWTNSKSVAPWSGIKEDISMSNSGENIKEILNLYRPIDCLIEERKSFDKFIKNEIDYMSNNFPSMFYSISYCDFLRKMTGKYYDFVIRARFDTLISSFPDLNMLKKDIIYVPDNCPNDLVVNDNFSICSSNIADIAYDIYNFLDKNNIEINSAEGVWVNYLKHKSICIEKIFIKTSFIRQKCPINVYKIAVILTGDMNNWNKFVEQSFINNIVQNNNVDIYISTNEYSENFSLKVKKVSVEVCDDLQRIENCLRFIDSHYQYVVKTTFNITTKMINYGAIQEEYLIRGFGNINTIDLSFMVATYDTFIHRYKTGGDKYIQIETILPSFSIPMGRIVKTDNIRYDLLYYNFAGYCVSYYDLEYASFFQDKILKY